MNPDLFSKSLLVGMKRELIHAEEQERRKRRKEDLARLPNSTDTGWDQVQMRTVQYLG